MNVNNQLGDTIIEVMIALAIVGSVIGISYATTSRSLNVGRQAQERTEALKLVEGQIEQLKSSAKLFSEMSEMDPDNLNSSYHDSYKGVASFCLRDGVLRGQATVNASLFDDPLTFNNIEEGKPVAPQIYHNYCAVGVEKRYKLSIVRRDDDLDNSSTFVIRARWERLGGGRDEITMFYRIHRGQF